jgi:urocanate hydratase
MLWICGEKLADDDCVIDLGSDQTSLHNPFAGGYYPVGLSFEESNKLMASDPKLFKEKVYESLRRQVNAIEKLCKKGMYFWDYGNAFLLESGRAGAEVFKGNGDFIYPSYVQDIMGAFVFRLWVWPFPLGLHFGQS